MTEVTVTVRGLRYDVSFDGDEVEGITAYGSCEDLTPYLPPSTIVSIKAAALRKKLATEQATDGAGERRHAPESREDWSLRGDATDPGGVGALRAENGMSAVSGVAWVHKG